MKENKKATLFLINPNSGHRNSLSLIGIINKVYRANQGDYHLALSESKAHTKELIENYKSQIEAVAVAGGDGTIHEVGNLLTNTQVALGIIPKGSGNGIARHHGIPLKSKEAVSFIKQSAIRETDVIRCNDRYLLGVGGIGFDAQVASSFEKLPHRGLWGYVKAVWNDLQSYKAKSIKIELIDGSTFQVSPYLLAICNTSQYGNNAFISPESNTSDGKFELCWVDEVPWYFWPDVAVRMFSKKLPKAAYYHCLSLSKCKIHLPGDTLLHLDGEITPHKGTLDLEIIPKSLKLMNLSS